MSGRIFLSGWDLILANFAALSKLSPMSATLNVVLVITLTLLGLHPEPNPGPRSVYVHR